MASAIPAPTVDEPATGRPSPRPRCWPVAASGVSKASTSTSKGVTAAQSGYAGGDAATANYDAVTTETTGHAESVRITYDPTQITYGQLLQVFFGVVQDPTELNYQGPDVGPSYRSVIFAQDDNQRKIADAYIAQLNAAGSFSAPIVTTVSTGQFFPAEAYHQDFLSLHPNNPYIVAERPAQARRAQVDVPGAVPRLASSCRRPPIACQGELSRG